MKKFTIFLIILFFISAIWFGPANVEVGTSLTDRVLLKIDNFSDAANNTRSHQTILEDLQLELEALEFTYQSIPDVFTDQGTLVGLMRVVEFIGLIIMDIFAVPLALVAYVVAFLIDAIIVMLRFFDFFTIFEV